MKSRVLIFSVLLFACNLLAAKTLASNSSDNEYYELGDKYLIRDNLYEDKSGKLFFLKFKYVNKNGKARSLPIYRSRFFSEITSESLAPLLSEVVDPDSWRRVSEFYYRDKNRLYCTTPFLSDYALLYEEGIQPDLLSFNIEGRWKRASLLNSEFRKRKNVSEFPVYSWFSSDGQRIFYACLNLEDADYATFKIYVDDETHGGYAKDKKYLYKNSNTITQKELEKDIEIYSRSGNKSEKEVGMLLIKLLDDFNKQKIIDRQKPEDIFLESSFF